MVYGWTTDALATVDVRLASGMRLHSVDHGPADGPAVLMLHGITDSSFSFSRVLPLFPPGLRAIVPDQRGHGRSDCPAGGFAVDDFAHDGLQLLDALGIRRAVVVGHSMGSFVARRMAVLAPDRVERLVLVGTAPLCRSGAVREMKTVVDALTDPVDRAFVREFQMSTVHRRVPDEFMARVIDDSASVPARVWKGALSGLMEYDAAEGTIACPTLVLGGEHDAVFSRSDQQSMALQIPGAVVKIVPGIGHTLHWEDPARFVHEFRTRV